MGRRPWVLAGIAVALAVLLGVMVANLRSPQGPRPVPDEREGAAPAGGGERAPRPVPSGAATPDGAGPGAGPEAPAERDLVGAVIDSFSKGGIAGAVVDAIAALPAAEGETPPAPVPDEDAPWPPPPATPAAASGTPPEHARAAADGSFRIAWPSGLPAVVSARAPGYGRTSVPAEPGRRAEIVLSRGGSISGRTLDPEGRPVAGAWLRARGEGAATPEAWAQSDADGRFEVKDLAAGRYALTANAAGRTSSGVVVDLPGVGDVSVVLSPALVAWLAFRGTGDALPARARASAAAGDTELASRVVDPARTHATKEGGGPVAAGPLRVVATVREVVVTVSAAGFRPWTSEPIAVPAGGGDVVLEPVVERDPAFGGVRLRLADGAGGGALTAKTAVVRWMRADGGPVPLDVAAARDEALRIEGLPPGEYRLAIAYPGREPTESTVTVSGGGVADARASLSEGARVRVRVKSASGRPVRVRLTQAGQPAVAFPEAAARRPAGEGPESGVFLAGTDGTVLTGLGSGPYTVEVVDPRMSAEPVEVRPSRSALRDVDLTAVPR